MRRSVPTFYWYDLETSGTHRVRDRIMQFAGVRTNHDLEELGEPVETFVPLPAEVLPNAESCLITGLTPQQVNASTRSEWQVMSTIQREFSVPSTTIIGFNSIRFDDEFIRHAFYRNFFDPYSWAYENGNSRADLFPLVLMCAALRPDGIEWPTDGNGPTFRQDDLCRANGIVQSRAHTALSDVRSTLEIARRLRAAQPRLWQYGVTDRERSATDLLEKEEPFVHISPTYGRERWCAAPAAVLAPYPDRKKSLIVCDLSGSLELLLEGTPSELRAEIFRPKNERAEGWKRPPVAELRLNAFPMVAPLATLDDAAERRTGTSKAEARDAFRRLKSMHDLKARVVEAFSPLPQNTPDRIEEERLYDGFVPNADQPLLTTAHSALARRQVFGSLGFTDDRLPGLAKRLRAREFPDQLTEAQRKEHAKFVRSRLMQGEPSIREHLTGLRKKLRQAETEQQCDILQSLIEHDELLLAEYCAS